MSTGRAPAAIADDAVREGARYGAPAAARSAPFGALTFGWRGMLKVKHVPEQLLDVTITPVMFVLLFTYLFGGRSPARPRTTSTTSCRASS